VYQTAEDKGYSPQTFGLAVGMQQRFAPGTGSYVTMVRQWVRCGGGGWGVWVVEGIVRGVRSVVDGRWGVG
jgi:hypothetical protein